jgi:hypothetical protein
LQAYGSFLAERYRQGNIIWCMGGDYDSPDSSLAKQWNIVSGIRSVRTTDLITGHVMSDASNADDAYTYWHGYPGFNLNTTYGYETNGFYSYALAAQAYSRNGPLPFIAFEGKYENSDGATAAMLRRQSYCALLSGACGQIFGNMPVWHFGSPNWHERYIGSWQSNLNRFGSIEQQHVRRLFSAYQWWRLAPTTDGSFVRSELGTGAARVYPALADDGSFAMIWAPAAMTLQVDLSRLSVDAPRIRLYRTTSGTYADLAEAPPQRRGVVRVVTDGECVVVIEQAA